LLVCGKSQRLGIIVMGSFSLMHWVVVLFIILIIFGAGKLPRVMGDFAKGIKAFKSGMKEEEMTADGQPQVTATPGAAAQPAPHATAETKPGERL
jgi:sec-independent protein translocase protein TatA